MLKQARASHVSLIGAWKSKSLSCFLWCWTPPTNIIVFFEWSTYAIAQVNNLCNCSNGPSEWSICATGKWTKIMIVVNLSQRLRSRGVAQHRQRLHSLEVLIQYKTSPPQPLVCPPTSLLPLFSLLPTSAVVLLVRDVARAWDLMVIQWIGGLLSSWRTSTLRARRRWILFLIDRCHCFPIAQICFFPMVQFSLKALCQMLVWSVPAYHP